MKERAVLGLVFASVMLVAALFCASCSCGKESGESATRADIEETIRGYVETYNARDYAQCLTYFTDYGDLNDALDALAFFRDLSGELGFQEIREVAITNQTAIVTVVFTIGGEESIDQMQLKEVDGQWKIVW